MKLNQPDLQAALLCGEAVIFDEIDSTNEYLLRCLLYTSDAADE